MRANGLFTTDGILAFHSWTHGCLEILLTHVESLPEEIFTREVDGFGIRSIRDQFVHLFECEVRWVHRAQGKPFGEFRPEQSPTVSDARKLRDRAVSETRAYFSSLAREALNSRLPVLLPEGNTIMRTPAELLHHVLTHAFHHKGMIVAMCRLLGHPAPNNDLIWLV